MAHLKSNFFSKLGGSPSTTINFDQSGLTVNQGVDTYRFAWNELESPACFSMTLFGGVISFRANGKNHEYKQLQYFFNSKASLFSLWANVNAEKLQPFLDETNKHYLSQFLRCSDVERFQLKAIQEVKRWKGWKNAQGLSDFAQKTIQQIEKIAQLDDRQISSIRQRYIHRQLEQFAFYFDTVESNPLTEKQRIACITDNDNNLLLAGAGTGKTSVMVGRSGYLIRSGLSEPEDILLLAYGKIAAKEMDERIKDKLGIETIRASTFHSLGMKIIAEVENTKPTLSPFEDDSKAKFKWMSDTLEAFMLDAGYRDRLLEYFSSYYFVDKNPFDFKSEGAYLQYLNDNDICSMKGDRVKSYGEVVIANWLYRNGINYQYEAPYRFDVSTKEYRQYCPDFYLPDHDIYIEYYGTDEHGNTAPWIDKDRYQESIEWKRQTHDKYQTGYIEVFYHQHKRGELLSNLAAKLVEKDVQVAPLSDEALLSQLKELGQVTELAKLFCFLVDMYKAACLDDVSEQRIIQESIDPKQTEKALELLYPLYHQYQEFLREKQWIDFNDMIGKAIRYVQSGQFVSKWKYILVDEFQDISEPRARLVKLLRDSLTGSSLFCVGDDWQAIYRFSGADVKLTTDFSAYFGPTSKTTLDLTFRFNNAIGQVATQFVTQNPVQIKKDIQSLVQVNHPAVSILRQGKNENGVTPLEKALNAIVNRVANSNKPKQNKVYLLARFWHQLPNLNELRALKYQFSNLQIEVQSFHASKGKEADYVVIMGLTSGKHGFPSEKVTPPLVDALLPSGDDFDFSEERRLFYVALTRAKHRAYLLADMTDVSEFVVELLKKKYAVDTNEFEASFVQTLFEQISCRRCKVGVLKERQGRYGDFLSCSFYPRCKHKETPCDDCGNPMSSTLQEGVQICINPECAKVRPLCRRCGSEMRLRNGRNGQFWGCANYRKNADKNCQFTMNVHDLENTH